VLQKRYTITNSVTDRDHKPYSLTNNFPYFLSILPFKLTMVLGINVLQKHIITLDSGDDVQSSGTIQSLGFSTVQFFKRKQSFRDRLITVLRTKSMGHTYSVMPDR
jgi:hypothetical protein